MAGFALGRKRFVGRTTIFWVIVATMMVPAQVIVVPLYLMMARFHLIDSLFALILPALAGPYGIFLMKQYLEGLPSDLEDAARIDGCSEWGVYRQVILPLSKPVLGVLAIFVFISNWNAFLWPLIVLNSPQRYTLTVGLATLQDKHLLDYGLLMAGASVAATPLIAVFLIFQKFAVKGITVGALKG
jgi:multiple sugar transport system permease protein